MCVRAHGVDLLLFALQLLGDLVHLLQVLQVTLHPVYLARVTPLLEFLNRLFGVLLFIRKKEDLLSVVLEKMGYNAKSNACTAASDNINLFRM